METIEKIPHYRDQAEWPDFFDPCDLTRVVFDAQEWAKSGDIYNRVLAETRYPLLATAASAMITTYGFDEKALKWGWLGNYYAAQISWLSSKRQYIISIHLKKLRANEAENSKKGC